MSRYTSATDADRREMLDAIGAASIEELFAAIPEDVRPRKDQPYYHLLAENEDTTYVAYVSEQNLLEDETGEPVAHPQVGEMFTGFEGGRYKPRPRQTH